MRKILIASDHAGFKLKEIIKQYLSKKKIKVVDLGPSKLTKVDYPDYAHKLSKKINLNKKLTDILVCGSEWAMSLDCKGGHAARFLSRSGPTRHVIQPSYLRRLPSCFDTLKIADAAAAGSEDRKTAFRLRCILYGNINKPPFKS